MNNEIGHLNYTGLVNKLLLCTTIAKDKFKSNIKLITYIKIKFAMTCCLLHMHMSKQQLYDLLLFAMPWSNLLRIKEYLIQLVDKSTH